MSSNMEISPLKSSDRAWTWIAQDFADEVIKCEQFCIRFKTVELAASFKAAFDTAINIVKETESKVTTSPRVSVTTEERPSSHVAQKGFGSQFMPKAGSWSCTACYVSNTADKLSCVACDTKKPSQISNSSATPTNAASNKPTTVQSPIVSFKATSNENQFKFGMFGLPLSTQSSPFLTNSTTVFSASATPSVFGGFTFSSSPMINEAEEPDVKDREILVVSTKAKNGPQVSKVNQTTSSPFSGFSFGKSPTSSPSLTVQISDTSRNVTVTNEKPTVPFPGFSPKPFASTVTTFSTNIQSSTINCTGTTDSSLSKMQSMVQNVKPAFSFEPKTSFKTPSVSFADEALKVSTDLSTSFGTSSVSQPSSNTNRLSTDGSPEEFVPTAEFKPVVPLPALIDTKTGEEEEEKLFEERAKLFRYDTNTKEWKERGTGELKILYPKNSHKYRILMRRDQVLKICANHYILPEMKLEAKGDKSWVWFAQDFSEADLVREQFAARFKTTDIAKRFQAVFLNCQTKLKEAKLEETVTEDQCKGNSATFDKLVISSSAENVPEPHKEKLKPLSELFKPDVGTWECKLCYVRNKLGDSKCVSCESPNPSSTAMQKDTVVSSNLTVSSSVINQIGGFGNLFKPQTGSWECKTCYVRNDADKTKCVSCETNKSGSSTTKPFFLFGNSGTTTASSSNTFGAFKFGSSDSPKPPFSFGTAKTGGEFVFGVRPATQPATFSFGHSTVSNKENESVGFKPSSNAASIFGGGAAQKIFGEKNTTSDSSTKFSFGDLAASREAESGTEGFTFGSPQKYEFSFDGVRPRSPSKGPKSPRSPATPSEADEEDEGDSDADNIYFQPVIPLPPKVCLINNLSCLT